MQWRKIIQSRAEAALPMLADGSIDLIVTSPPYDDLRTYNGTNQWSFEAIAPELYRVLSLGGLLCWNRGDSIIKGSESLTSTATAKLRHQAGEMHQRALQIDRVYRGKKR